MQQQQNRKDPSHPPRDDTRQTDNDIDVLSERDKAEFVIARARMREAGGTIGQAVDHWLKTVAPYRSSPTVKDLAAGYLRQMEGNQARPSSVRSTRYLLARFCKTLGDRNIASVQQHEIEAFISTPKPDGKPASASTRRTIHSRLRPFLAWCVRRGHCSENLCDRLDKPRVRQGEPETYSIAQIRALLDLSQRGKFPLCRYLVLGLFCGLRPAEIGMVRESDINLDERRLAVNATKTGNRRVVELSDAAVAWLTYTAGMPTRFKSFLFHHQKLHRAAGVPIVYDGLRHSFASYSAPLLGVARVAEALGHVGFSITRRHYVSRKTVKEATEFAALRPAKESAQILLFEPRRVA